MKRLEAHHPPNLPPQDPLTEPRVEAAAAVSTTGRGTFPLQAITTGAEFDVEVMAAAHHQAEEVRLAAGAVKPSARIHRLLMRCVEAAAVLAVARYPGEDDDSRRYRYLTGWQQLMELVAVLAGHKLEYDSLNRLADVRDSSNNLLAVWR